MKIKTFKTKMWSKFITQQTLWFPQECRKNFKCMISAFSCYSLYWVYLEIASVKLGILYIKNICKWSTQIRFLRWGISYFKLNFKSYRYFLSIIVMKIKTFKTKMWSEFITQEALWYRFPQVVRRILNVWYPAFLVTHCSGYIWKLP